MKRISDAARCRRNGWTVGTILEGKEEGSGVRKIRITAIGDFKILAMCVDHGDCTHEGDWTLSLRKWRKVR